MKDKKPAAKKARSRPSLALAGLAVAAILAGVYVTFAPESNGEAVGGSSRSAALAAAIDPLIGGDVAALVPAKEPKPVPMIGFVDAAGKTLTPADWRGRVVLLNLWATWCAPCRREMPALDRLQESLGSKDFEVVAVNLDRGGPQKGQNFYAEIGLRHLAYYHDPDAKIFRDINAIGMPTTLLIDRDGYEIARMAGPAEWDSEDAKRVLQMVTGSR